MDAKAIRKRLQSGISLYKEGKLLEAAKAYAEVLQDHPNDPDALQLLGTVEIRRNNLENARVLISKALKQKPDSAVYNHNIAYIYGALGQGELAEGHYRKSIACNPSYAEAYFNLAGSIHFTPDDPAVDGLQALLGDRSLSRSDRVFAHFAAGKAYDDLGQYDLAFEQYAKGNAAKQAQPNPAYSRTVFDNIIAVFSEEMVQRRGATASDSEVPIFVVGMPRSGTSLVEQVLASHPQIHGAGELPDIASIAKSLPRFAPEKLDYPHCVPTLPPAVLPGLAEAYLRRLREMTSTSSRVVDKAPLNFLHAGLIALMFPRARIVHCLRDPLDTCLSCYFQNFASGQQYSFDLEELARFYCDYRRLMEHWSKVLEGRILDLHYEELVSDLEGTTRRLLEDCGLEWDPACADFHRTERAVRTASRWQVRQPIYRSAVGRWRNYAQHLEPLRAALGRYAAEADS